MIVRLVTPLDGSVVIAGPGIPDMVNALADTTLTGSNGLTSLLLKVRGTRPDSAVVEFEGRHVSDAPIAGESGEILEQSPMKPRLDKLLSQFNFKSGGFGRRHATLEISLEGLAWIIAVDPWPFAAPLLSLSMIAEWAPVAKYENWQALKAATRPVELRWRLIPVPATA